MTGASILEGHGPDLEQISGKAIWACRNFNRLEEERINWRIYDEYVQVFIYSK